jgi:hypothetical protein
MDVPNPAPLRLTVAARRAASAAVGLATALAAVAPATAAEVTLRGTASFRVPDAATLAALPADAPLRAEDLRSGSLAFEIAYDDATPDAEPDTYAGRYSGAIRAFRVRVGERWLEMPAAGAQLIVSDGGFGIAYRESVQMISTARQGALDLRVGWVQINQATVSDDLRGARGSLASDRLPPAAALVAFRTSGEYDRAFFVRLDPVGDARRPVLYLSANALEVGVVPAATR